MSSPLFVAVDWSGRASGAAENIWIAVVSDGQLVELENGLDRGEVIERLIEFAAPDRSLVVGLDFAFSFPAWFCASRGWASGPDAWRAARDEGEGWLAACEDPFWGRTGRPKQQLGEGSRRTEATQGVGAKSIFQIGGAGAVGTGSIRGMPHLLRLAEAGFAIWPFDQPGPRTVVEIYPRLMTGGDRVIKRRHRSRRTHLSAYAGQDPVLLERAAGSEDAFDAAISALQMAAHASELNDLKRASADAAERIEGEIWRPRPGRAT